MNLVNGNLDSFRLGSAAPFELVFKNADGSSRDATGDTVYVTIKASLSDPDSAAIYETTLSPSGSSLATEFAPTVPWGATGSFYVSFIEVNSAGNRVGPEIIYSILCLPTGRDTIP